MLKISQRIIRCGRMYDQYKITVSQTVIEGQIYISIQNLMYNIIKNTAIFKTPFKSFKLIACIYVLKNKHLKNVSNAI